MIDQVRFKVEWRDMWVGLYWTWEACYLWFYIVLVPCLPLIIRYAPRVGHLAWHRLGYEGDNTWTFEDETHQYSINRDKLLCWRFDDLTDFENRPSHSFRTLRAAVDYAERRYTGEGDDAL